MDYLDLIIEEKRHLEKEREESQRPFLQLPVPELVEHEEVKQEKEPKRVIIIEL